LRPALASGQTFAFTKNTDLSKLFLDRADVLMIGVERGGATNEAKEHHQGKGAAVSESEHVDVRVDHRL
jgi:hypothetical protein